MEGTNLFTGLYKKSIEERRREKDLNKKINKGLKIIKEDLGFKIPLTTYVARATYATIMIQNNMPLTTLESQNGALYYHHYRKIYWLAGFKEFDGDF